MLSFYASSKVDMPVPITHIKDSLSQLHLIHSSLFFFHKELIYILFSCNISPFKRLITALLATVYGIPSVYISLEILKETFSS